MPRRATYVVPKLAKPMSEDDLGMVLATIARAAATSTTARRDFVMVKGSYLLGCRVSELCRLQWKDIEPLEGAGQVHLLGKGSKPRTVRISTTTLELFEALGRGAPEDWLFPSKKRNGPLTRQLWVNICLSWLEPFLVGNASVGEAHNLVDRHLSLQSVQDVLPPPVLHEVDALRTFRDQRSPP